MLLAGCGGSDSTTQTSAGAVATATATTASPPSPSASPSPSAAATTADDSATLKPRGSKVFLDKANGYQVAVPSGYTRVTSKAELAKILKAGSSTAARGGISQQMFGESVKMIAVNRKTFAGVNVVVTPAGGMTADQLPAARPGIKKMVAKIGARNVVFKSATMGGEPALRASYKLSQQGVSVLTVQYITVHDDRAYTLTFSQSDRLARKLEQQTVGSFRFS
jgi:hypothetical protein